MQWISKRGRFEAARFSRTDFLHPGKGNAMKLFIALVLACIFLALPGCAALLRLQGQASTQAANGIAAYCKNTDATFRARFEAEMNAKAAPNSASIFCAASP
jgi:hypothetical protein